MSDPTYSYTLKDRTSKGEDAGYYLYLTRILDGKHNEKYLGKVTKDDPRVKLILKKRENDLELRELAIKDAKEFF